MLQNMLDYILIEETPSKDPLKWRGVVCLECSTGFAIPERSKLDKLSCPLCGSKGTESTKRVER